MSFKDIFCQDRAIGFLHRAFATGRWAHTYIFTGLDGVGKYKTACEWGKLLLCSNPIIEDHFADSCGSCESCRLFEAGSHPDFNHVYKELKEFTADGKGKTAPLDLPIDVIREFLIAKVSTRPTHSQRKVFIISEAEKLNISSQNCLLKVLEEPPAYCCIVLLCTRLETLLPTIKSRSQIIRFGPVDENRIAAELQQMGVEKKQALYFTRLAQGSLGSACRWTQLEAAGADLYQTKRKLVSSLSEYELVDALSLAEDFLNDSKRITVVWSDVEKNVSKTDINRRAVTTLVRMIISVFHDTMVLNSTPDKEIVNFDQREQIERIASRFEPESAAEKISECYGILHRIESNVNEKLIFGQLLLSLADFDTIKNR